MKPTRDPPPAELSQWPRCRTCGQPAGAWSTDQLTGVLNRWGWHERAPSTFINARAVGGAVTLLYVDVDRLKEINDVDGHRAGDALIMAVADELKGAVGSSGLVCRIGGDEFLALLPFTDATSGVAVARRIRDGVRSRRFEALRIEKVTTSIGVATTDVGLASSRDLDGLIDEADTALALAKRRGRDRICTAYAI
jgi:diguanylate cyclase (GGDEF)-like protein